MTLAKVLVQPTSSLWYGSRCRSCHVLTLSSHSCGLVQPCCELAVWPCMDARLVIVTVDTLCRFSLCSVRPATCNCRDASGCGHECQCASINCAPEWLAHVRSLTLTGAKGEPQCCGDVSLNGGLRTACVDAVSKAPKMHAFSTTASPISRGLAAPFSLIQACTCFTHSHCMHLSNMTTKTKGEQVKRRLQRFSTSNVTPTTCPW